jgi:SHS2 domain-containing protein
MTSPSSLPFQELDHTADLCLRVWGHDLPTLFDHAAQGLFWLMRASAPDDDAAPEVEVRLEAGDAEALLVDWLNELLYLSDRDRALYRVLAFDHLDDTALVARLRGAGPMRREREVKAATFFGLSLERTPDGDLTADITLDV